jgi:hypothetical protein
MGKRRWKGKGKRLARPLGNGKKGGNRERRGKNILMAGLLRGSLCGTERGY